MTVATTPAPLLTTREVADVLRCRPQRVRELVAAGALRPVRLSERGYMRFRPKEVERFLEGEERAP